MPLVDIKIFNNILNTQKIKTPSTVSEDVIADVIIDAIQDVKGKNIVKLDLRHIEDSPTQFFIICEGDSTTQIKAITESISSKVKEVLGLSPSHKEGVDGARWILVDYFNTVVHVLYPETRAFYELEELWGDARVTQYENI
jgi:ribosome-associated protein